jgi:hypothetical protein
VLVDIAPGIKDQKRLERCFTMPSYIAPTCAQIFATPKEQSLNGLAFNAKAQSYFGMRPNVLLFKPQDAMCPNNTCLASDGETFFYSDRVHMTVSGARRVIDYHRNMLLSLTP